MINDYAPLVQAIKDYLKLDWHVSISHIYREANFIADYQGDILLMAKYYFFIKLKSGQNPN